MSSMRARLQVDLAHALKKSQGVEVQTLRMLEAAVQNEEIARKRAQLSDEDVLRVFEKEAKRRREAADMYRRGGREDRAGAELVEAAVIARYLPTPLTDAELFQIVRETIAGMPEGAAQSSSGQQSALVGKVMGTVMGKVRGRADGTRVRDVVSRLL